MKYNERKSKKYKVNEKKWKVLEKEFKLKT